MKKKDFRCVLNVRTILFLLFFVIIAIVSYGWRLGTGNMVHSDETCLIFVGQDWFSGNVFLRDWWLSTGTFGLTTFELTILTAIFGYHDTLIYAIAGMNYSLMIMAVIFVVYKYVSTKRMERAWAYAAVAGMIVLSPRFYMHLHAGTQVLVYAVAIISLYITCNVKGIMKNRGIRLLWGILLGFLAVTNTMFLYTACIPILVTGVLRAFATKVEKEKFSIAELGIVSVGSCVIFQKIWEHFRGMELGGIKTIFTTRDKILNNLITAFCNVLELYGINFWGASLFSLKTISALVGLLALGKITLEIYHFVKNGGWKDDLLFDVFLSMAVVNLGAYTFSTVAQVSSDVHLLQPFLIGYTIAGSLAWVKNAKEREEQSSIRKMIVISFLLMILLWPSFTLYQPDNTGRQQAAQYLVENGYEKGFATFWSAASVMYEAEGKLIISPVSCYSTNESSEATLHAQQWMNKEDWIVQEGNFLVLDSTSEVKAGVSIEGIIATFGEWSEMKQFADITVYTWDEPKALDK